MKRPIREQVVVITGASSGIGQATALAFAQAGAKVVLAARNETALQSVAQEIEGAGGTAFVMPTDLSVWAEVETLAAQAVQRFGRIDTWVNNAGVSVYSRFEDMTLDEFERVVHVNLMSQVHGVKAVLPYMKQQGGGTIINIGSVLSKRAVPLQSAYCASKHAVKGFSDSLRMELQRDKTGIDVVLVMPASTNTPFFNHARSRMGVKPQPIPPVYPPEDVARAILHSAEHPKREVQVTGAGVLFSVLEKISPAMVDRFMVAGDSMFKLQQTNEIDDGVDNLYVPSALPAHRTEGDFAHLTKPSVYNRLIAVMSNWQRALLVPVVLGGAIGLWKRVRSS